MCGSLGIGCNLLALTAQERSDAARWIALYKEIRPIVQLGDAYRLRSAQAGPFSAVQYLSHDAGDGVLFAFRTHMAEPVTLPPLYLRGLDSEQLYVVDGFPTPRSGASWMHAGLSLSLSDFQSTVRRIRAVPSEVTR